MRLYLSSYKLGNKPEEFVQLLNGKKRVGVIVNAIDHIEPLARENFLADQIQNIKKLGLETQEIDLRTYFSKKDSLEKKVQEFDGLWVTGGNAFTLRRAFRQSGFDTILPGLLDQDKLVYAGFSAGVCVLAPMLDGYELCDDPNHVPENYPKEIDWEGLGILDYAFLPHYKSDHRETELIDKVLEYMEQKQILNRPIHDGQAIVVNGKMEFIVG